MARARLGMAGRRTVVSSLFVALALVVLMTTLVAWPFKKTEANVVALSYGGGPFEGRQYQRTVGPGSRLVNNGLFDKWFEYPSTQRNYIISKRADEGDVPGTDFIVANTNDRITVDWELQLNFKLNTNDEVVRRFHETLGLKFHAYGDSAGWDAMLRQTFRPVIENVFVTETRNYSLEKLYSDPTALLDFQSKVGPLINQRIKESLGGDYFCGPAFARGEESCPPITVVVRRPSFPQAVVQQFEANRTSEIAIRTARNDADRKRVEAEGEKAKQELLRQGGLSPEAQVGLACAQNPSCTMIYGSGSDVIVDASKK